jgi:hypothetical protein
MPEAKYIKMILQWGNNASANKNKFIKAFCQGHIHFAWNDRDFFIELLNVVKQGLHESDSATLKPFLVLV